jgi:3-oxoacyl-[acyl-carrier-protein] synthase-3
LGREACLEKAVPDRTLDVGIVGMGSYLPERVVGNRELAQRYGCSEEWILSRTGIRERRFVDAGTGVSAIGAIAAGRALANAGVEARDIDAIICATYTPDRSIPATACVIQDKIGAKRAAAFDMQAACSGFVYGLITAAGLVNSRIVRNVLVIGADIHSNIVDPDDRKVTAIFGDGAGAAVVRPVNHGSGILGYHFGADGSGLELFYVPSGGSVRPTTHETVNAREHYLRMDGKSLFRFGVDALVSASRKALESAGLGVADVDLFVPHQANLRIIDAGIERLGLPRDRCLITLDRYANTAAATIPIALDDALVAGRLKSGMVVLLTGFGAGLTWGSVVLRWS